ncbi:MAG: aspartyl protease [Candidatus Acidiferrales bacterium]
MGVFSVRAKLYRGVPSTDGLPLETDLLVDTGATFTVIPRPLLAQLDVEAVEHREVLTVERKLIRRQMGYLGIEVAGRRVFSPVHFGEPDDFAVLGAVTLEIAGLVVDPEGKEIFVRPSLLL